MMSTYIYSIIISDFAAGSSTIFILTEQHSEQESVVYARFCDNKKIISIVVYMMDLLLKSFSKKKKKKKP